LGWRLAQVVENLSGKHEVLRLSHSTNKKKYQYTNNIQTISLDMALYT
jgi:hypothetical protein